MFRRSTPHQCSLVHIYTCSCITPIHVNLLSPSARGTRQHNQHMRTCVERHRARVLKRPQGKWALHICTIYNMSGRVVSDRILIYPVISLLNIKALPPQLSNSGSSIGYTKVITCHKGRVFIGNLTNE